VKEYGEKLTVCFERNDGDDYTTYEAKVTADCFHSAFEAAFNVLNAAYGHGPEVTLQWIEEWVTEYRRQWFGPSYVVEEE
jgi:aryl-alcohol dehydrogenase-like predicted oxidoreductase